MDYSCDTHGQHCNIRMNGKFTFDDNTQFKEFFTMVEQGKLQQMVLDVGGLSFVDSAALGMLLLLREKATANGIKLTLSNPQGQVRQVFTLSRFDRMFDMS